MPSLHKLLSYADLAYARLKLGDGAVSLHLCIVKRKHVRLTSAHIKQKVLNTLLQQPNARRYNSLLLRTVRSGMHALQASGLLLNPGYSLAHITPQARTP